MSASGIVPKPDWRDKEIKKKHAKLLVVRRHNEELKKLLAANGIPVPEPEPPLLPLQPSPPDA
jgi:hypothetical protein